MSFFISPQPLLSIYCEKMKTRGKVDMWNCCFGAFLSRGEDFPCSQYQNDVPLSWTGSAPIKNMKLYSYNELRSATENFNPRNKLGQGGFGTVYKGILRDGKMIAVKVLVADSRRGNKQFIAEIEVITDVKHQNLVELIGCCLHGKSWIIVFEYMENNSLHRVLLSHKSDPSKLNWSTRSSICIGTAKGLSFLHEELDPPIVHRDIKASNVLLDQNYIPKIGDFGLARLFPDNITHISTGVAGTIGYLAPEYALHGQLTKKADVYSFGILLLEIISGRSISRDNWLKMDDYLLNWAWKLYKEGRLEEMVDPTLEEYNEEEVFRCIKVALFCTQRTGQQRPKMHQVVEMLSTGVRLNEKELSPPGFIENPDAVRIGCETAKNPKDWIRELSLFGSTGPFSIASQTSCNLSPR